MNLSRPTGDGWRVVVDYPFDDPTHTPNDDRNRVEQFVEDSEPVSTVVWLPNFLSGAAQRDLGMLVMLDEILKELRFPDFVAHLPPVDRPQARVLLDNQRSQLRQRLVQYLEAVYGIRTPEAGWTDPRYELPEHVYALNAFRPKRPVGATLNEAFHHVVKQALDYEFPNHPEFGTVVARSNLKKVLDEVTRAMRSEENRIAIDQPNRLVMRQIAVPLKLGEMGETHFVRGEFWKTHFLRKHAQEAGVPMTVGRLRSWIDDPQPLGLTRDVQNLLILVFAAQTDRALFRLGVPITGTMEQLPDEIELRLEALPAPADWQLAIQRAAAIFGVADSPLLNGQNVAKLAADVRALAARDRDACRKLRLQLKAAGDRLTRPSDQTNRGKTADAVSSLVDQIVAAEGQGVVAALARATVPTTASAMGTSLKKAAEIASAIENTQWGILDAACELPDERATEGRTVKQGLGEAFANDELATAFADAVKEAQAKAVLLIRRPVTGPQPPSPGPKPGRKSVIEDARKDLAVAEALPVLERIKEDLKAGDDRRLTISWSIDVEERKR